MARTNTGFTPHLAEVFHQQRVLAVLEGAGHVRARRVQPLHRLKLVFHPRGLHGEQSETRFLGDGFVRAPVSVVNDLPLAVEHRTALPVD
jgi:hypothetical protein